MICPAVRTDKRRGVEALWELFGKKEGVKFVQVDFFLWTTPNYVLYTSIFVLRGDFCFYFACNLEIFAAVTAVLFMIDETLIWYV